MSEKIVNIDYVSRVEGEGSVYIKIRENMLEDLQFKIFEPPRFFEALLKGRKYDEAPDITSRICGICPVAYQLASNQAMEKALGIKIGGSLKDLRKLLNCGQWIESHALHIYLLHLPDFFDLPDAISLAKINPQLVKSGLELKSIGNMIISLVGGRPVHPVNVRVGGFYKVPTKEEIESLKPKVEKGIEIIEETLKIVAKLNFPNVEENYEFVAMVKPDEYPMIEGNIASSEGINIPVEKWEENFEEIQVPYSNAYHVVHKGKGSFITGPLARYALNYDNLTPRAKELSEELDFNIIEKNPYRSIIIRSLEVLVALEETLNIIDRYVPPPRAWIEPKHKINPGYYASVVEAPRGLLYHKYFVTSEGMIEEARIVAPTTMNQKRMEDDLKHIVSKSLNMDDVHLMNICEKMIRNYDPCISCATHFLDLKVEKI
ncbi:MAG: Ni/Fe hydrogenase subunit alpha [Euryarchaeota archaeon]|nr:Ni/Fe hydrogenase subunit alpha [Euryarchaeota archaeon]